MAGKARRVYERAAFASSDPAIARFAQFLDLRRMSPRTSVAYQRDLESFGSFLTARAAGDDDLDRHRQPPYDGLEPATTADVLAYVQRLNGSRAYAPRSLRRKISALRTFYKFLKFDGRRPDNPATDIPSPKIGKPLPKALTEADVDRLLGVRLAGLTEAQRLRDRAILECLYSSGIRRSELLGLDVHDVDLDGRTMRVVGGKGNKDRTVPLTRAAAEAMRAYLGVRPRTPGTAFFIGRGGARLSESALYKIVRTYLGIAGLEGHASPHTMRHTMATHLYENGADLLVIKEILGHESLATTQVYTKVARRRVLEQFDAAHPRDKR
ncbi:MAG: tyrosine-type recombinase/integrase [Candidatus Eremiobacteraeota bacterium]|nr:tyrosine-type recombinase/integrase [Candidatus Eremiobacteraeota bacterium]MBV8644179.1 tyrosine-type recombinase/integrase [Candidatus Eremiobacteraeota bacterium]